jgi:spore maturation protein CgeB
VSTQKKSVSKILVVGDFHSDIYEKAFYEAFIKLGFNTDKFSWHEYFGQKTYQRNISKWKLLTQLWPKIQYRYSFGPIINRINEDLIAKVRESSPDLVFIYRGIHILPKTLKNISKSGIIIFGYNNDDPFSKKYPFYFWRHFMSAIFLHNYIFSYRYKNINEYNKIGYNNTSLLRSYYIAKDNFPITNIKTNKYECDVTFIGHFEDDGRDEYIKTLIDNGINLKLFGPDWQRSKHYDFFVEKLGQVNALKEDYNLAINSAKIALVFLSKLNNDTYTRRVFEIIVTKTLMLSTYTDDLNSLFEENKEAVYFRSKEDLLKKVKFYLSNPELRSNIAKAGYDRLLKDGHEVSDRVKEIIRVYNIVKNEKNINS